MSKKSSAVVNPNMGLFLDRARIALSGKMLSDGLNFRVKEGKLTNVNMGWTRFGTFTLNGPVMMIQDFNLRSGVELLVFASLTDLYSYNGSVLAYITPRYQTG